MLKKIFFLCFCILPIFLCSGCFDQQIFENTAIILYAGAEIGQEDKYLFSFATADNEERKGKLRLFSKEETLIEDAINSLNSSSENPLRSGKIQNIFFSEELAKKGILAIKDTNRLSQANRFMADYAIVEGSPKKMLNVLENMKLKSNAYGYIEELINNAADAGLCPNTLHHEFNIDLETDGIDPILPIVTYDEKKKSIAVKGTALFLGDRYVEKLSTDESRFLSIMTASADQGAVKIKNLGKKNTDVTLNITKSDHKVLIDIVDGRLIITQKINLHSYFNVSDWEDIARDKKKNIEKEIEKKIAKECLEVYEKIKACGSDPFAVKARLRAYHNDFYKKNDFAAAYQNAVIRIQVNNTLTNQNNP